MSAPEPLSYSCTGETETRAPAKLNLEEQNDCTETSQKDRNNMYDRQHDINMGIGDRLTNLNVEGLQLDATYNCNDGNLIDSSFLSEVQPIPALHFLVGEEDSATEKNSTLNLDSPKIENFPVLEMIGNPNYVEEDLIEETTNASGRQDSVDVLIPSSSVYSRSPKLVSAVQTVVKPDSFHQAPICKPLIVDLQKEAKW